MFCYTSIYITPPVTLPSLALRSNDLQTFGFCSVNTVWPYCTMTWDV